MASVSMSRIWAAARQQGSSPCSRGSLHTGCCHCPGCITRICRPSKTYPRHDPFSSRQNMMQLANVGLPRQLQWERIKKELALTGEL